MDSAPCDLVIESLDSGCHGISTMPAHSPLIRCGSSIGLCVHGVHELTRRRCPEIRADFGCEPLCPVEDTTETAICMFGQAWISLIESIRILMCGASDAAEENRSSTSGVRV